MNLKVSVSDQLRLFIFKDVLLSELVSRYKNERKFKLLFSYRNGILES